MKILVICRDNIGDSILATPLIAFLHTAYGAVTDVLTNSYSAPVFSRNPHIRTIHQYRKSKHCEGILSITSASVDRIRIIFKLRREKYDAVIIAKSAWDSHSVKWVAGIRAKQVVAFGNKEHLLVNNLLAPAEGTMHVAEQLFRLGAGLRGLPVRTPKHYRPGKSSVYPDPVLTRAYRVASRATSGERIIALQISARKPGQQWSAGNFITLARLINERYGCRIFLFWSPGGYSNPMHPGDDLKAEHIAGAGTGLRLQAIPTRTLEELKAALSLCSVMVSSDGGAVHVAAALGLPVVALYGNSDPAHWHPWQVPYKTLRGRDGHVNDITPENVMCALDALLSPGLDQGATAWNFASPSCT